MQLPTISTNHIDRHLIEKVTSHFMYHKFFDCLCVILIYFMTSILLSQTRYLNNQRIVIPNQLYVDVQGNIPYAENISSALNQNNDMNKLESDQGNIYEECNHLFYLFYSILYISFVCTYSKSEFHNAKKRTRGLTFTMEIWVNLTYYHVLKYLM